MIDKPLSVLSLFNGISVGRLALDRLGIPIDKYYSSEIDKYAIAVTKYNYPDTIELGDIKDVRGADLPPIDLVLAGFPCPSFSAAGNQAGFDDPRGQLFFESVRLKNELNAPYFLFENVFRMKKEYKDIISEHLGVEAICLDSSLVSAQDRKRLYWTNIPIGEIEDRGILLRNIILDGIVDRSKSHCITGSIGRTTHREYLQKNQGQMVIDVGNVMFSNIYGGFGEGVPRVHEDKSVTLRTAAGGGHIPYVLDGLKLTEEAIAYMSRLRNGKPRWDYHTNPLDGKAACLTANMFKGVPYGVIKELLRKLHPVECERLQTLPDGWTEFGNFNGEVKTVSNTQRYKMIGNAWNAETIVEIFKGLL